MVDPIRSETDAQLRRLIDAAPFGAHVYELSADGRLVFAGSNESANRILGVDCAQFVGLTIEEAFPALVGTEVPDAYRSVARDGLRYHEEQIAYDSGAISGVFDVYAFQLAPGQMATFFLDITERRRAEAEKAALEAKLQQAQKMEAIGAMAGGIAHDFNNLLTAIRGYAELLRVTFEAGDPRVDDTDQIRRASDTAAGLIRQLLAFSRREMVHPTVLDLGQSVRNSERILRRVLGEQVVLMTHIADDLDPVFADETQVVQVVLNLAVNARDAMPNGGTLTIAVANADVDAVLAEAYPPLPPGRFVVMTVADTGNGMDQGTLDHIFEPFFTTKAPGHGTGLGMSTVYGIVKATGGWIYVESHVGSGSKFTIYLPSDASGEIERGQGAGVATTSPVTGTILVAEDEPQVRGYVTRVLEARGHRVLTAEDGRTALAVATAASGRIDVLLTDVIMPGMSGRDLAERARQLVRGLRVVYMSGYANTVLSDEIRATPNFQLLTKPFTTGELELAIAEALNRAS